VLFVVKLDLHQYGCVSMCGRQYPKNILFSMDLLVNFLKELTIIYAVRNVVWFRFIEVLGTSCMRLTKKAASDLRDRINHLDSVSREYYRLNMKDAGVELPRQKIVNVLGIRGSTSYLGFSEEQLRTQIFCKMAFGLPSIAEHTSGYFR